MENIVDDRVDASTKKHMFLVKWKGYPSQQNTWEPRKHLESCGSVLKAYEKKRKEAAPPKKRGRKPKS